MRFETVHFTREDVVRGNVPWEAAHVAKANATCVIEGADGVVRHYHATECCAGAAHPHDPGHPFRWARNAEGFIYGDDGEPVELSEDERISLALADEDLRKLKAEGMAHEDALAEVLRRFPDEPAPDDEESA